MLTDVLIPTINAIAVVYRNLPAVITLVDINRNSLISLVEVNPRGRAPPYEPGGPCWPSSLVGSR